MPRLILEPTTTRNRTCEKCHCILPKSSTESVCETCKERELFAEVKDYIRNNNVNEFQVAKHFDIPLAKVKHWIKDGRVEYNRF